MAKNEVNLFRVYLCDSLVCRRRNRFEMLFHFDEMESQLTLLRACGENVARRRVWNTNICYWYEMNWYGRYQCWHKNALHHFCVIIFILVICLCQYIKKTTAITIAKLRVTSSSRQEKRRLAKRTEKKMNCSMRGMKLLCIYYVYARTYRRHHMCNTVYWICECWMRLQIAWNGICICAANERLSFKLTMNKERHNVVGARWCVWIKLLFSSIFISF